MKKVAVLGAGAMGIRMARRLLEAGHELKVWNRSPGRLDGLVEAGASRAETPAEAARGAELVLSMLTDDEAARQVWLAPEVGALHGLSAGAVAVESSTVTPGWVEELSGAVEAKGAAFLDAPVAGSRPQAEAGALIFLVGGDEATLSRAHESLACMASAIHHGGPVGAGARLKLAVNAFFAIQVAALAEGVVMLQKAGLEVGGAVEILKQMPITSPALQGVGGAFVARFFGPMFPIDLVAKDLGYVLDAARQFQASTPLAQATHRLYQQAQGAGWGDQNITGILQLFEQPQS